MIIFDWHALISKNDLQDLKENWPTIYNSTYYRQLTANDVYNWIGEFKDHLQQNWIADGGLISIED
jgi:hypothetical protein